MPDTDDLNRQLSALQAKRDALTAELSDLVARVHEIRAAAGNPFCYSHPEHADESIAQYTGYASHAVVLPTFLELRRVEAEIARVAMALR